MKMFDIAQKGSENLPTMVPSLSIFSWKDQADFDNAEAYDIQPTFFLLGFF